MLLKKNTYISFIKKYGYWIFAITFGYALIVLDGVDGVEPMFSMVAFVYWMLILYWSLRWLFRQIKSIIKQKQEKKNIELLHLQSQVNPHFFFNTLNNLYGLVEKDSKKAQELILKLSDMMRYSIYDGQQERVSLQEELAYLKNYMELQKMRYHKNVDIRFNENILDPHFKVMPLLFILLVENAFKHGVEHLRKDAYVTVNITSNSSNIHFEVINNFDAEEINKDSAGIGIKNLKRRLEIGYPNAHKLTFNNKNNVFKAELTLQQ